MEDLQLDPTHKLKKFFQYIQAHFEAQPYYPLTLHAPGVAQECGKIFSDNQKIQIATTWH